MFLVIPRNEKNERFYTDFEINILNNIKTMRKTKKLAHGLIKEMIKKSQRRKMHNMKLPHR
ncbi:hypothetical protein GCM10020331_012070 [Ectobacillus funiculus]